MSARFFSSAQDVSTAELQKLWGKVLAGEVERPGTVPLRTLELLRNMTKAEADLLLKVGSRVASNSVYLPYGSLDLSTTERLLAQDAGFLPFNRSRIVWKADVGASVENQAIPQPPSAGGIARVPYPSGHVLELRTNNTIFAIDAYVLRASRGGVALGTRAVDEGLGTRARAALFVTDMAIDIIDGRNVVTGEMSRPLASRMTLPSPAVWHWAHASLVVKKVVFAGACFGSAARRSPCALAHAGGPSAGTSGVPPSASGPGPVPSEPHAAIEPSRMATGRTA